MDQTSNTSQEVLYDLNCLIDGESIVFPVAAKRDTKVGYLKEIIRSKRELDTLKDIGPHTLELWKVSAIDESRCKATWLTLLPFQPKCSLSATPSHNLVERFRSMRNSPSEFADFMEPTDKLYKIFPGQPSTDDLHVIVVLPGPGE